MYDLSETQKDALDHAANAARVRVVGGDEPIDAWGIASKVIGHKSTIGALTAKGLFKNGALTAKGIKAAKRVWKETSLEGTWDESVIRSTKKREVIAAREAKVRDEWNRAVAEFPVPEGYQEPRKESPFQIEYRAIEFAHMPTISLYDKTAPYGFGSKEGRYKPADWIMNVGAVGEMDRETIKLFINALDMISTIMTTLEIRHADDPVLELH